MMNAKRFRIQSFWVQLVVSFLVLTLISLLLFQLIFSYSLQEHMQAYTRGREDTLNSQIVTSLAEYYAISGTWSGIGMPLFHAALSTNTRLMLYDEGGQLVGDTGTGRRHMMMVQEPPPTPDAARIFNFPIEVEGRTVAELVIAHPLTEETSVWLQQDLIFRRALTRSLIWTGLAAAGFAFLMGIFFSRRFSRPIEDFVQAADNITRGNYELQFPSHQSYELDHLAGSIKLLASHLSELEKLRKRSVADIAHELRTPLSSLRSYVEAIQDEVMPADRKTLAVLLNEITHLTNVANSLDELTRAENLQPDRSVYEAIDIKQLLKDKVATFKPRFKSKGIMLNLHLPKENILSKQEPTALRKIISNLIDNAYRYTNPGGMVEIVLENKAIPVPSAVAPLGQDIDFASMGIQHLENMFTIKVSDTGSGISADYLPYIFERFFRADPARGRDDERTGSGIGLSLVKELVRAAGGFILVSSRVGEGTTFYLYLPHCYTD